MTLTSRVKPPDFGQGVYAVSDVARLIRRHYSTVYSWFRVRDVFTSDYAVVEGAFGVSFYDLIDALIAVHFRDAGVSMPMVRKAYKSLAVTFGTDHPFCHRGLYTDGSRVIVNVAEQLGLVRLLDAVNNQRWFGEFKSLLARVSYSERTKLAMQWDIARGVVVDPELAMGYPVVAKTGVTTHVISRAFHANGGNIELVASMYGLKPNQVRNAVTFESSLKAA